MASHQHCDSHVQVLLGQQQHPPWPPRTTGAIMSGPCRLPCSNCQMMGLPTWFRSLVVSEIVVQLPFFFVATYAFLGRIPE